jgi:hypothetical protein
VANLPQRAISPIAARTTSPRAQHRRAHYIAARSTAIGESGSRRLGPLTIRDFLRANRIRLASLNLHDQAKPIGLSTIMRWVAELARVQAALRST